MLRHCTGHTCVNMLSVMTFSGTLDGWGGRREEEIEKVQSERPQEYRGRGPSSQRGQSSEESAQLSQQLQGARINPGWQWGLKEGRNLCCVQWWVPRAEQSSAHSEASVTMCGIKECTKCPTDLEIRRSLVTC